MFCCEVMFMLVSNELHPLWRNIMGAGPVGDIAGTGGKVRNGAPTTPGAQPPRPKPGYMRIGTSIGGNQTFSPLWKLVNISIASTRAATRDATKMIESFKRD